MGKTVSFKGELAGAFVGAMRGEQPKTEEDELLQLVMLCVAYKSTPKKAVEVLRDYMSEDLVESVPKLLKDGISKIEAAELQAEFEAAGAKVDVR